MSEWSYIHTSLTVDLMKCVHNPEEELKRILEFAPKITGSEGGPDIFINVKSGHNTFVGGDCEHCFYGNTIKYYKTGGFSCKRPEEYKCPEADFQTICIITIHGGLRDRNIEQTRKEFKEFKKYLKRAGLEIIHQAGRV